MQKANTNNFTDIQKIHAADIEHFDEKIRIFVSERLRYIRKKLKMSQADLGRRVGITQQQIQKYESGRSAVSVDRLLRILIACECSLEIFFGQMAPFMDEFGRNGQMREHLSLLAAVHESTGKLLDQLHVSRGIATSWPVSSASGAEA